MNVSDLPHVIPACSPGSDRPASSALRGWSRRIGFAVIGAALAFVPTARAQWTFAGNATLNAAQTYDGAGVDSALNPRVQGATNHNTYVGSGGTGSMTIASGSLTILANDFKFGRNNNPSHGTLTVASGATFRIEQTNQWGGGIAVAGANTNAVTGTLNIAGSMTWFLSGSSEQRMTIGGGGANTVGTVNLNGGTLVLELDSGQAVTDNTAGLRVGTGSAGRGTINLGSGLMTVRGNLPLALGGAWTTTASTPVFNDAGTNAGLGLIQVNNGRLECLGSPLFAIGTDDYVNFIVGGSGSVSILGWNNATDPGHSKFKALIDAGKIRLNNLAVTPGDYSGFVFSDTGAQGVISAANNLVAPLFIDQPDAASAYVAASHTFVAEVAGNLSPSLQWEKSTNAGASWSAIPGAQSATLAFASVVYADNGLYRLVATNSQGVATSDEVAFTVTYPAPVIITAPISQTVLAGADVTLLVSATGLGSLSYQWRKNGVDISDQTGVTLSLADIDAAAAADYDVVVTDHAAEADSLPATTTIASALVGVLDVPAAERAISLNFVGAAPASNAFGGASDLGVLTAVETTGVLPVANWNNSAAVTAVASQTTPLALSDNTGAATTVSATWSSANTWAVLASDGAASAKSAAGRLLHGYIERRATVAPGNASVSLAQIPYGTYDVYVYLTAGTAGAVGKVAVNGNDAGALHFKAFGPTPGLDPAYVQSTAADLASAQALAYNSNFVRFAGVTGASLSVTLADAVSGGGAGGIAGISIVDTTPAGSAYPPLVTSVPASLLKRGGASASFSISASSVNPGGVITYAWSKNGSPLPGANGATLDLGAVDGDDSGTYSVFVTDTSTAVGSPTTAEHQAVLVVVDAARPALLNVDLGTATTSTSPGLMLGDGILRTTGIPSSAANSGLGLNTGGPGTDLWTGLVGAVGSTTYSSLRESTGLGLAGVSVTIAGVGGVVDNITAGSLGTAANGSGPLLRDLVFTDNQATPITGTIAGLVDFAGKKFTLVVYAVGTRSTLFGENTVDDAATVALSGDNNHLGTAPFMTRNVEGRDLAYNTEAYAVFEGIVSPAGTIVWTLGPDADAGSIPLNGFQLLLTDADIGLAPVINTEPASATRLVGLSYTFTAGVTASPAPALQWQKSADGVTAWTGIPGANSASHTIPSVAESDGASYRLVATNSAGMAASAVATLTVQSFPPSASRGISVNWQRDGGTLLPAEVAGVVGLANWDNRTANTATFSNLIDSTGASTTAAVQLGSGGNWRAFTTTATLPMQQLFKGYWDFAPGSSAVGATGTMTVTGLIYASYDVYVYFVTDAADNTRTAQLSVNGGAPVYGKLMGLAAASLPLYMAQATAATAEAAILSNYVKVTGLTGSGFTVTATKVDGNYGIVGFQIINTGPSATPLESWRQTHFSTTADSGSAANTADPDGDGLANLLEYAFGENPVVANDGTSVVVARSGGVLTLTFVHIDDPAVRYVIEASNDLVGSWSEAHTYTGFTVAGTTTHDDTVALGSTPRRFLRVKVVMP